MTDPTKELKEHQPKHSYIICIDSDGCAFDTMELKHKECFIPNIVKYWGLQAISRYTREAAEFVNLYSKWRGINRFPALTMVFDLLNDWDIVKERGIKIPEAAAVREWMEKETQLSNNTLKPYCEANDAPDLKTALDWSVAVNDTVADMVHGVAPFPSVKPSLEKASAVADMMVCSATPFAALTSEWTEHGLHDLVFTVAGQEQGSKKEHIEMATKGRYEADNILMIGDAPGDMRAAHANNARFFPIVPNHEEESWKLLHGEALDRFTRGTYKGAYEDELTERFLKSLPDTPPWKTA
jgi:phosphoglycolate phosphatase-like HAD superfamily hydrolase